MHGNEPSGRWGLFGTKRRGQGRGAAAGAAGGGLGRAASTRGRPSLPRARRRSSQWPRRAPSPLRTVLPLLAEWLCDNNGKDDRATRIVKNMHLFIIPTMNPDGFANKVRENRCAPERLRGNQLSPRPPAPRDTATRAPPRRPAPSGPASRLPPHLF